MRPIDILLVEDSEADVDLLKEAMEGNRHPVALHVVPDGIAALAFLRRQSPFEKAPRPVIVLLDLNLPRKDGREVLQEIKADPALRELPVIIMSSSAAESDIRAAYARHANCYITKALEFDAFTRIVRQIEEFWLGTAKLPPRHA